MVERKEYLDQLWAWKDERQIKVVTGIRRCGKSVLLEQYQQRLLANGVAPEQIISINFENLDYEPLKDYMRLYNYLKERLCVDKMTYIFLDEVQEVPSFEKVVDSLYIRDHVDVYITGSNAYIQNKILVSHNVAMRDGITMNDAIKIKTRDKKHPDFRKIPIRCYFEIKSKAECCPAN